MSGILEYMFPSWIGSTPETQNALAKMSPQDLVVTINGKPYIIDENVSPNTPLLAFIRNTAGLKGTKGLCYEGGCGICTVVVSCPDLESGGLKTFSAQACQIPVYSCHGWAIQTIEHLGDKQIGYHKLQQSLVGHYGTQCGFCSPGIVMTMYGNEIEAGKFTMKEIEMLLDGNICRCTGYRPILDAFKSFASDAPKERTAKLADIEESYKKCSGGKCKNECSSQGKCSSLVIKSEKELARLKSDVKWYKPVNIEGVYSILENKALDEKVKLVVGNTSKGVFKGEGPFDIIINLQEINELWRIVRPVPITIGANVSLSRCIAFFLQASKRPRYQHLQQIAEHWGYVANVGIRNLGSWAGNFMMKHAEPWFPSDIFVTLLAADAKVEIGSSVSVSQKVGLEEFLKMDMSKSVILSLILPPLEKITMRTFKITPRSVNAHAYINAAFKFQLDENDGFKVLSKPNIIFNGINSTFNRASRTEESLNGIKLTDKARVLEIIRNLSQELSPDNQPQDASPKYRTELCQALLYKTILSIIGDSVKAPLKSGGPSLQRPVSKGTQKYDENKDTWPVGQAIPKLESNIQVSGEAQYAADVPEVPGELYGYFVQSTVAKAKIISVDASQCLLVGGVVDFISAKDIPGVNSFVKEAGSKPDPVFADSEVGYHGQSIGLVVATSNNAARVGAKLVKVEYEDIQEPVLTIRDSIQKKRVAPLRPNDIVVGKPDEAMKSAKHIIEGEFDQGTQFHFPMEAIAARVAPTDEGYDVIVSSQWPTEAQKTVADNLNIPNNLVHVTVKRLGGGFGFKISRGHIASSAAAIAAHKLKKPVRIIANLTTTMTLLGWREPYYSKYKVGFDDAGLLECIDAQIYSDGGHVSNEISVGSIKDMQNVYHCPNWRLMPYAAVTDTAANTWCRTPGHPEIVATTETIMDHIASYLKKDSVEIREINLTTKQRPPTLKMFHEDNLVTKSIFPLLKKEADIAQRRKDIAKFNKDNRWKKRGHAVVPLHYQMNMGPFFKYNVHVVIYADDGTISITTGGIEMGQGLNTKCAQVAAKILEVPIDIIKVKATNTFTGANSVVTGGSYGSDLNAHGTEKCCEELKKRMDVVKEKMKAADEDISWKNVVRRCFQQEIDLSERFFTYFKTQPKSYDIWAASSLEVELDILTGQFLINRADIIEDCGRSLSPYVDVGQVEGAFIMGLGFYTTEKVKFNTKSGEKLSNGTWEYKPPLALDIPVDLRISFLSNRDNTFGVQRSKATGEPALCMSYSIVCALREAITSAREDAGQSGWFNIDTPLTVEKIQQLCMVDPNKFEL